MNHSFRPLPEVLTKVIRDAGLTHQVDDDDFREWALFALREIGAYSQFERKCAQLEVDQYQALLPEDYYLVDETEFQQSYKIQLDSIITRQKTGTLTLHYLAFPTREDEQTGELTLLIPDIASYESAIQWFIYSRLCLQGKFPNPQVNYEYANAKWLALRDAARGDAGLAEMARLQTLKATVNDRMNPRFGFGNHGMKYTKRP